MNPVVLVIDDEPSALIAFSIALKKNLDCSVLTAHDAEAGFQLAESKIPDVIVCDAELPVDAYRNFLKCLAVHPELSDTTLVLTVPADRVPALSDSACQMADGILVKPSTPDKIAWALKPHLENARLKKAMADVHRKNETLQHQEGASGGGANAIVGVLSKLLALRVPGASLRAQHAVRAASWAGRKLNLDEEGIQEFETSAQLRELGKILLPDSILLKATNELTPGERNTLSEFPILGQRILEEVPGLEKVALILRSQMENYGGDGYPDRLMSVEIPRAARFLRLLNFIGENLVKQKDVEEVIQALHDAQGTFLDPVMVQFADEYLRVEFAENWMDGKRQIAIGSLEPGMVLAADIFSGSGTKLLPKDTRLTASYISKIAQIQESDPIMTEVFIYDNK